MYSPRGLSITKGLYGVTNLYTGGDYAQGGIIYGREKKSGKESQHLQSFNSGNKHFTLENKNKTTVTM